MATPRKPSDQFWAFHRRRHSYNVLQEKKTQSMQNSDFASFVKKRKLLIAILLIVIVYLGAGIAFREYRMNPQNEYYSTHLPSAARPTSISSTPEEAMEELGGYLFREPNLIERIFTPAERLFRLTGY
jgi:hypothetical protein